MVGSVQLMCRRSSSLSSHLGLKRFCRLLAFGEFVYLALTSLYDIAALWVFHSQSPHRISNTIYNYILQTICDREIYGRKPSHKFVALFS